MCGIEDAYSWVSLRFSSPLDAKDVLHILCSRVADPDDPVLGTADLYFERFDPAYCCYGGADEVRATRSSMQLLLNEKGRKALAFEGKSGSRSHPISAVMKRRLAYCSKW